MKLREVLFHLEEGGLVIVKSPNNVKYKLGKDLDLIYLDESGSWCRSVLILSDLIISEFEIIKQPVTDLFKFSKEGQRALFMGEEVIFTDQDWHFMKLDEESTGFITDQFRDIEIYDLTNWERV